MLSILSSAQEPLALFLADLAEPGLGSKNPGGIASAKDIEGTAHKSPKRLIVPPNFTSHCQTVTPSSILAADRTRGSELKKLLGLVELDEIGGKIGTQRGYKTCRLQIHIDIPQLALPLIFFLLDLNKKIDGAILAP